MKNINSFVTTVLRVFTPDLSSQLNILARVVVNSSVWKNLLRYLLGAIIGAILLFIAHPHQNHHTPDYTRQAQLIQNYRQMMQRDSQIIGLLLNEPHDRSKEIHKYTGKNLGQWYFVQE